MWDNPNFNIWYEIRTFEIKAKLIDYAILLVIEELPFNEEKSLTEIAELVNSKAKEKHQEYFLGYSNDNLSVKMDHLQDKIQLMLDLRQIFGILDTKKGLFTRLTFNQYKSNLLLQNNQSNSTSSSTINKKKIKKPKKNTRIYHEIDNLYEKLDKIIETRFEGHFAPGWYDYDFYEECKDVLELLQKLVEYNSCNVATYLMGYLKELEDDGLYTSRLFLLKSLRQLKCDLSALIPELIEELQYSKSAGMNEDGYTHEYSNALLKTIIHLDKDQKYNDFLISTLDGINRTCTNESDQLTWSIRDSLSTDAIVGCTVLSEMMKRRNLIFIEVLLNTLKGSIEILMHQALITLGEIEITDAIIPKLIQVSWQAAVHSYSYFAPWAEEPIIRTNSKGLANEAKLVLTKLGITDYTPYLFDTMKLVIKDYLIYSYFKTEAISNAYAAIKQLKLIKPFKEILDKLEEELLADEELNDYNEFDEISHIIDQFR